MEQRPEATGGKKVEDVPSPVGSMLSNKKVIFYINVFVALLVAVSAGAVIGLAIFRNTAKEMTQALPDGQAGVKPPVMKTMSSASNDARKEIPDPEKTEKRAQEIKLQNKKTVKKRKQPASGQVARVPGENLEKTLQAAKEGNAEAQFRLGSMYARGAGVKKDMGEAYRWYRRAAGQGHEKARDAMDIVYE